VNGSTLAAIAGLAGLAEDQQVEVAAGTLLSEAARQAGIDILMPCGGQGRCGRCAVIVEQGAVRRRSTQRLSPEDVAAGYALACQTTVEGDVVILIPPQEKIERRLKESQKIAFQYDESVVDLIANRCTEVESGARAVDAILTHTLLPEISRAYLSRLMDGGAITRVSVGVAGGEFTYDFA
jgi:uncharacterized 2Fe-2S/4Fe-4S cluster protein (DUF4445 family)